MEELKSSRSEAELTEKLVVKTHRVTGLRLFFQQLEALLVKNATLTFRNKPALLVQFFATFFFILLIYGVNEAIQGKNKNDNTYQNVYVSPVTPVGSIPDCTASVRCGTVGTRWHWVSAHRFRACRSL